MLLDPTTTTKAFLFMNGFHILVVRERTKREDVLCHHDGDVTLPLLLRYSFLHTRNSINVKWWWWQWNDEEQHWILEFRIARDSFIPQIFTVNLVCTAGNTKMEWACAPPGKWGLFPEGLTCEFCYPWWDCLAQPRPFSFQESLGRRRLWVSCSGARAGRSLADRCLSLSKEW